MRCLRVRRQIMALSNNIIIRLREAKVTMTPVEKQVAEYVEAHLYNVPSLSVKELAQASRTSEASIIRFCKSVGCRGYREFALALSSTLGSMEEDSQNKYTDVQLGDSLDTIISNVSRNNFQSIEDTLSVLNKEEVEKAVKAICEARKIDFYGVGASGLVCQDAYQKFMRINKRCAAYADSHSQLTAAALLEPDDVAIFVSNSGNTVEILDTLYFARKSGAKTIAITRYSKSKLAREVDIVLHISSPEITFRSGAMGSRIAMLNIVDILFSGVASIQYKSVKAYLSRTHDALMSRQG